METSSAQHACDERLGRRRRPGTVPDGRTDGCEWPSNLGKMERPHLRRKTLPHSTEASLYEATAP